jgi:hypothetical protein
LLGLAIIVLWLSATTNEAAACPAGSPCLKYRRNQTVNVQPEYYARAGGGTIPAFDRKKLARYLATRWKPVFGDGNGGVGAKPAPKPFERDHEGNVFVDVDGIAYQLWYCASGKQAVPCLTNSGNAFNSMFPIDDNAELEPVLKSLPL